MHDDREPVSNLTLHDSPDTAADGRENRQKQRQGDRGHLNADLQVQVPADLDVESLASLGMG
ncbi:hypothetical protein [Streptomyces althioticus]|uniref:hypothetical protein n=1 Tax=Streptomyces althioticus TaxID=83380 RepID=UPI0036B9A398